MEFFIYIKLFHFQKIVKQENVNQCKFLKNRYLSKL